MNRFFSLPACLLQRIYEYDGTYRTLFSKNVLKKNNSNNDGDDDGKLSFYQTTMEKRFSENNHGTILTIMSYQYFNLLKRVLFHYEIKIMKQYPVENLFCLGKNIQIQKYQYLLLDIENEIPSFMNVPDYICMYYGITIYEIFNRMKKNGYYGWIWIYNNWTNQYKKSLCGFVNWTPSPLGDDNDYICNDKTLQDFVMENSHFILNCKMASMYFMGCNITLYQTEDKLYINLDDNEMSMMEEEKEWNFNKIISGINNLLNI